MVTMISFTAACLACSKGGFSMHMWQTRSIENDKGYGIFYTIIIYL